MDKIYDASTEAPISLRNRVMIVEDDPQFLAKFSDMLQKAGDINLLATATDFISGLAMVNGPAPDALLVDLKLPDGNGLNLIQNARKNWGQKCRILVITVLADSHSIISAIFHGADGYILKRPSPRDFVQDVRDLLAGGSPICPQIASDILKWYKQVGVPTEKDIDSQPLPANPPSPFTKREQDVLEFLAKGFSQKETAYKMNISPETIKEYIKRITQKMYETSEVESQGEKPSRRNIIGLINMARIRGYIK